ncbi:TRAP transporter substrate-binding protein [Consotaella salsifontis]|uniref:Tripartite ATP-independent transporter solute receptor, DctP family n=1 Tax=Consotaella salsifontis TaxID=1365950 RepID=A0A1T4SP26_9HYPH|nr:TRAP transporter substrate-binding protein [Consotaella salsifontis]SKA29906.1 tripartite ATP-independent transporter solute receptor, DctP family [Consotaella salsifontis]
MKLTRSFVAAAALAVATALPTIASAADYTMIMAHTLSDTKHPIYQAFLKLKKDIEERSGGRIEVVDQGGGALGGDREIMESTMFGDVQFGPMASSGATQFIPELAVFDIPYVMPTDSEERRALTNEGPLADAIAKALEAKGLRFEGTMDGGFRNLTTSNTEVHTPKDIADAGLRIRVQENPIHIAIWKALGAAPTPISFPELYGALQQGVVDGQENPYGHILSQHFYEVQKYLMNTRHIFLANLNIINLAWYQDLPDDLKKVVDDSFKDATDYQWQLQAELEQGQRAELAKHMTIVDLSPEELKQFQEKTADVIDMVREKAGNEIVDTLMSQIKK